MDGDIAQGPKKPHSEDDVFYWQDYLEATNSVEVPQIMFQHVEETLHSGIEIGMSLEVPVGNNDSEDDSEAAYWVATVVINCGPLLGLRYFGGDDRSLEFWFNLTKETGHELGWSIKNDKRLEPPKIILERSPDCSEKLQTFMTTAKSIPLEMLTGDGPSMVDRIKPGMKVKVGDIKHPFKLWIATIKENVGGRLLLRYDTPGSSSKEFWMFCTSEHLHHCGVTLKTDSKSVLEPPSSIVDKYTYQEWKELIEKSPKDLQVPENVFNNSIAHHKHQFELGMKLEAISPDDRTKICPATVVKVFDDEYFLVHIDEYNRDGKENIDETDRHNKNSWLCTVNDPYIFPAGWAKRNNISLTSPENWIPQSEEFNWEDYLKATNAEAADKNLFLPRESATEVGFECGMRLEAVNPRNENEICAAHIKKIIGDLLWINLDNCENAQDEHIVHMRSLQMYPVGWCESNHYPLKPPKDYVQVCKKIQINEMEMEKVCHIEMPLANQPQSSTWCPKIYFNYRCSSGSMICKAKLAALPKSVGPGRVDLVMKEVVSKILSVGYKSDKLLKTLHYEDEPESGYHLEVFKAKDKNNTRCRASIAIITFGDMVAEFCRNICKKLMACPNLFGPIQVEENECPDGCQKTSAAGSGRRSKPKGCASRRGRWANRNKERTVQKEEEIPDLSIDSLVNHVSNSSKDDVVIVEDLKSDKFDDKKEVVPSSNVSEDSRSSLNDGNRDGNRKDSNIGSPSSSPGSKLQSVNHNPNSAIKKASKRKGDWDTNGLFEGKAESIEVKRQRKLEVENSQSNHRLWNENEVPHYVEETPGYKELFTTEQEFSNKFCPSKSSQNLFLFRTPSNVSCS